MPLGDLNTSKTWQQLLEELSNELRKWGVDDIVLPRFREAQQIGTVTVKSAPHGEWTELSCSRFGAHGDGPQRNPHAIGGVIRTLRLADQRGIGRLMADAAAKMFALRDPDDPYAILGVPSGASPGQVRAAYLDAVKRTHPDHGGDPKEFQRVSEAGAQLGVAS